MLHRIFLPSEEPNKLGIFAYHLSKWLPKEVMAKKNPHSNSGCVTLELPPSPLAKRKVPDQKTRKHKGAGKSPLAGPRAGPSHTWLSGPRAGPSHSSAYKLQDHLPPHLPSLLQMEKLRPGEVRKAPGQFSLVAHLCWPWYFQSGKSMLISHRAQWFHTSVPWQ